MNNTLRYLKKSTHRRLLNRSSKKVLKLMLRRHDSNKLHAEESISAYAESHRLLTTPWVTMNINDFPESAPKTLEASEWRRFLHTSNAGATLILGHKSTK